MVINITLKENQILKKMINWKIEQSQYRIKELEKSISNWNDPKIPAQFKAPQYEKDKAIKTNEDLIKNHRQQIKEFEMLLSKLSQ